MAEQFNSTDGPPWVVAPTAPRLTVNHGPQAGQSFALDGDVFVIGRAASPGAYDVVLLDATVSRPHAKLVRSGDTFVLHDLDSTNGIAINYVRVAAPQLLQDGDLINLGRTVLLFRTPASLPPPVEPAVPARPDPESRVLTFFGLKGGVGTTTLAVNAALRLRALTQGAVLLVDLSVEHPAVGGQLPVVARCTIDDLVTLPALDASILDSAVARHDSGLHVLPARALPEPAERVTGKLMATLLPLLKGAYEWIVLDTAASFSGLNLAVFDRSDLVTVVTAPDLVTLKATQCALDIFKELGLGAERRLLLNGVYPSARLERADVEKALGERVAQAIPYSDDVLRSIDHGKPLALAAPGGPIIRALDGYLQEVVRGRDPMPTLASPAGRRPGGRLPRRSGRLRKSV
jgi:MinD-like ATPase involved in chromosome partitioning or flagellar assembly